MFYKTLNGARFAGYIQSLIYSSGQNDINPYDYLHQILLHQHLINKNNADQWLPWHYKTAIQRLDPGKGCQDDSS